MKRVVSLFILTLVIVCTGLQAQPKISGGDSIPITEAPWQVLVSVLVDGDPNPRWCGGSIIAPNFILTAKHCLTHNGDTTGVILDTSVIQVIAGITCKNEINSSNTFNVFDIIPHPDFGVDAALLQLSRDIIYDSHRQPIDLWSPVDHTLYNVGNLVRVSGWGDTIRGGLPAHCLRAVDLNVISDQAAFIALDRDLLAHEIAATGSGPIRQGACPGDSGGPLTGLSAKNKPVLIGIVHGGSKYGCAGTNENSPSVFVRVSHIRDWIDSHVSSIISNPILGPATICNEATYTLSDSNLRATWSISQNSGFIITSSFINVNSVTVVATSLNGQPGTLMATVANEAYLRDINACRLSDIFISGPLSLGNSSPCNTEYEFTVNNLPSGITDWNWWSNATGFQEVSSNKTTAKFKRIQNTVNTPLPSDFTINYSFKFNGNSHSVFMIVSSGIGGTIFGVMDAATHMAVTEVHTNKSYYLVGQRLMSSTLPSHCRWKITPPSIGGQPALPVFYGGWSTEGQQFNFSSVGLYKIELITFNGCGWTKSGEKYIMATGQQGPIWPPICKICITYSPNPVNSELTIEFEELPDTDESVEYTVKLLDNLGNAPRQTRFRHRHRDGRPRPVRFNTSSLRPGTYYLHVEGGGELVREQIIVTR
ncbi:MAG: trypsin-like serine protease [Bacteroidales bacterium]|nr:trypsin-like serine protease [Bacteroidales bacterium]